MIDLKGVDLIKTLTMNSEGGYNRDLQEFLNVQVVQMLSGNDPRLLRSDPVFKQLFDLNKTIDPNNLILKNVLQGLWWTEKDADSVIQLLKKEYENKTEEEINAMIQKDREELTKIPSEKYETIRDEKRVLDAYGKYYYAVLEPGSYNEFLKMANEKGIEKAIEFVKSHPNFNEEEMNKMYKDRGVSKEEAERIEAISSAVNAGLLTLNEGRQRLDENPFILDCGKDFLSISQGKIMLFKDSTLTIPNMGTVLDAEGKQEVKAEGENNGENI